MSRDLRDLLTEFADAEGRASQATAPDPELEARLLGRRVARRRGLRAGAVTLTSAAAVVGLAVGVSALTDRDEDPEPTTTTPAPTASPTPTPTPSPTPSSTPTPEVTQTPDVVLPAVTEHPLLPEAEPMPPGTFERTGPGWVLLSRALAEDVPGDAPIERTYFYLLDPEGVRYEVPFDTDRGLDLADWLPGTSTVVVRLGGPGDFSGGTAILDLESGEFLDLPEGSWAEPVLTSDGGVLVHSATEALLSRYDRAGTLVVTRQLTGENGRLSIDPFRTRVAVSTPDGRAQVLDGTTLEPLAVTGLDSVGAARTCPTATWADASTLVVGCLVDDEAVEHWLVPLFGAAERLPVPTESKWDPIAVLDVDGVGYATVPVTYDDDGLVATPAQVLRLEADGTTTPLETGLRYVSATGGLLVGWESLPDDEWGALVTLDPVSGRTRPVVGDVPDRDEASGLEAMTDFVAAR